MRLVAAEEVKKGDELFTHYVRGLRRMRIDSGGTADGTKGEASAAARELWLHVT